jgi:hypothetical protein
MLQPGKRVSLLPVVVLTARLSACRTGPSQILMKDNPLRLVRPLGRPVPATCRCAAAVHACPRGAGTLRLCFCC